MYARLQALSAETRATFWRSLQTLNATRVIIALVLLAYFNLGAGALAGHSVGLPVGHSLDFPLTGLSLYLPLAYLALAVLFALRAVYRRHGFLGQLLSYLACDLVLISLLYHGAGGMRSGLAILYLFPLAGAAILAPLLPALLCGALVALFMLGDSGWRLLDPGAGAGADPGLALAALLGAAFIAVVFVVNRMAARLIAQEELAIRRGQEIDVQQAVNRLVAANIGDGLLVLDGEGRVADANPAARQMLGWSAQALDVPLSEMAALAPLAQLYAEWRAGAGGAATSAATHAGAFVTIKPFADAAFSETSAAWSARRDLATHLKVRCAAVEGAAAGVERSVMFLQDVTDIENQAQQLKLASMGRLTASIAHEVRNPLAAIGHAAALLGEELGERPENVQHQRLLKIVDDNLTRINRMVEDILQLSRKVRPHQGPLALDIFLNGLRAEFIATHGLMGEIVALSVAPGAQVRFDPLHLREVVLNLLNNALRYASGGPASIRIALAPPRPGAQRMELHVQDDGHGISPEVRAHLFEPFYSTASKGSGLGLYLARELCLNNEARLDYEYRFDADRGHGASGRFVIAFAHAPGKQEI